MQNKLHATIISGLTNNSLNFYCKQKQSEFNLKMFNSGRFTKQGIGNKRADKRITVPIGFDHSNLYYSSEKRVLQFINKQQR